MIYESIPNISIKKKSLKTNFVYDINVNQEIGLPNITPDIANSFINNGGAFEFVTSPIHTADTVSYDVIITQAGYPKFVVDRVNELFSATVNQAQYKIVKDGTDPWYDGSGNPIVNKDILDWKWVSTHGYYWGRNDEYTALNNYHNLIENIGTYPNQICDTELGTGNNLYYQISPLYRSVSVVDSTPTSSNNIYPVSNMVDGDFNTWWEGERTLATDDRFVVLDLGSNVDVNFFEIYWESSSYAGNFYIEGSNTSTGPWNQVNTTLIPFNNIVERSNYDLELTRIHFPSTETYQYYRILIPATEVFNGTYIRFREIKIGYFPELAVGDKWTVDLDYTIAANDYTINEVVGSQAIVANGTNLNTGLLNGYVGSVDEEVIKEGTTGVVKTRGLTSYNESRELFIQIKNNITVDNNNPGSFNLQFDWWFNEDIVEGPYSDTYDATSSYIPLEVATVPNGIEVRFEDGDYQIDDLYRAHVMGQDNEIEVIISSSVDDSSEGTIRNLYEKDINYGIDTPLGTEDIYINNFKSYRTDTPLGTENIYINNFESYRTVRGTSRKTEKICSPNIFSRKSSARSDHKVLYITSEVRSLSPASDTKNYKLNTGWNKYEIEDNEYKLSENVELDTLVAPEGYIHWQGAMDPYSFHMQHYDIHTSAWQYVNDGSELIKEIKFSVADILEPIGTYVLTIEDAGSNPQCKIEYQGVGYPERIENVVCDGITENTNLVRGLRIVFNNPILSASSTIHLTDQRIFSSLNDIEREHYEWFDDITLSYHTFPESTTGLTLNTFDDGIISWDAPLYSFQRKQVIETSLFDDFNTLPDNPPSDGFLNTNYWSLQTLPMSGVAGVWDSYIAVDPYPEYDGNLHMSAGNISRGRKENDLDGSVYRDMIHPYAWTQPGSVSLEVLNTPLQEGEIGLKIKDYELDINNYDIELCPIAENYISRSNTVSIVPAAPQRILVEYLDDNIINAGETTSVRITLVDQYNNIIKNSNLNLKVDILGEPDKVADSNTTLKIGSIDIKSTSILINDGYVDVTFGTQKKGYYVLKPQVDGVSLSISTGCIRVNPASPSKILINADREGNTSYPILGYSGDTLIARVAVCDAYNNIVENIDSLGFGTLCESSTSGYLNGVPTFDMDQKDFPSGNEIEAVLYFEVTHPLTDYGQIKFNWNGLIGTQAAGWIGNANSQAVFVASTNLNINETKVGKIYIQTYLGNDTPTHDGIDIELQAVGNLVITSSVTIQEIGVDTGIYGASFTYKSLKSTKVGEPDLIFCYCPTLSLKTNFLSTSTYSTSAVNIVASPVIEDTINNSLKHAGESTEIEVRTYDVNWHHKIDNNNTYASLNTVSSASILTSPYYVVNGDKTFGISDTKSEPAIITPTGTATTYSCVVSFMPALSSTKVIDFNKVPNGAADNEAYLCSAKILDEFGNVCYNTTNWGLATDTNNSAIIITATNCSAVDSLGSNVSPITPENGFIKFYYKTGAVSTIGELELSGAEYGTVSRTFNIYAVGDNLLKANPNNTPISLLAGQEYLFPIAAHTSTGTIVPDNTTLVDLILEKNAEFVFDIEVNNLIIETRFRLNKEGNNPSHIYTGASHIYELTGNHYVGKVLSLGVNNLELIPNYQNYGYWGTVNQPDAKGLVVWMSTDHGYISRSRIAFTYYWNGAIKYNAAESLQWNQWIKLKIIFNKDWTIVYIDDQDIEGENHFRILGTGSYGLVIPEEGRMDAVKAFSTVDFSFNPDGIAPEMVVDYYKVSSVPEKSFSVGSSSILHVEQLVRGGWSLPGSNSGALEAISRANFRQIRQNSIISMDINSKNYYDLALLIKGDDQSYNYGYKIRLRSGGNSTNQLWIEARKMPGFFNPNLNTLDTSNQGWETVAYHDLLAHNASQLGVMQPHIDYTLECAIELRTFTVILKEKDSDIVLAEITVEIDDYQKMWDDNNYLAFETYGSHLHIDNLKVDEPEYNIGVKHDVPMRFKIPVDIQNNTYYYWKVTATDQEEK